MKTPLQIFGTTVGQSIKARQDLGAQEHNLKAFETIAKLLVERLVDNKGHLYIAGNGGSAADSQHFAAELVGRFEKKRRPLAAEALTTDTSIITAIGNDFGFEEIFSIQLEAKAAPRDVFLALSTSGNAENIVVALDYCNRVGITSVLLTGKDGGRAKDLATYSIVVPSDRTSVIQSAHQDIYHSLAEYIEQEIK